MSNSRNVEESNITNVAIPQIDVDDLKEVNENGVQKLLLLSKEQIDALKKILNLEQDKRYTKAEIKKIFKDNGLREISPDYGIICKNKTLYAVYKGVKQKKQLGMGGYGEVKLIQDQDTGELIALKSISPPKLKEEIDEGKEQIKQALEDPGIDKEEIQNAQNQLLEMEKMLAKEMEQIKMEQEHLKTMGQLIFTMDYEHKKKPLEKGQRKSPTRYYNKNETYTLIAQKFHRGVDLSNFIASDQLSEEQKFLIANSMISKLMEVHEKNIMHGDIKPENFLCDAQNNKVALIDFNLAIKLEDGQPPVTGPYKGTPASMPPEFRAQKMGTYDKGFDIYQLGIALGRLFNLTTALITNEDDPIQIIKPELITEGIPIDPVLSLLNKMAPNQPDSLAQAGKLKLREIQTTLNEIYQNKINNKNLHFNVGVLDVNEFLKIQIDESRKLSIGEFLKLKSNDPDKIKIFEAILKNDASVQKFKGFLNTFKSINALVLTDNVRRDEKEYIKVKQFLNNLGIFNVANDVKMNIKENVLLKEISQDYARFQGVMVGKFNGEKFEFKAPQQQTSEAQQPQSVKEEKKRVKDIVTAFEKPVTKSTQTSKISTDAQQTINEIKDKLFAKSKSNDTSKVESPRAFYKTESPFSFWKKMENNNHSMNNKDVPNKTPTPKKK